MIEQCLLGSQGRERNRGGDFVFDVRRLGDHFFESGERERPRVSIRIKCPQAAYFLSRGEWRVWRRVDDDARECGPENEVV